MKIYKMTLNLLTIQNAKTLFSKMLFGLLLFFLFGKTNYCFAQTGFKNLTGSVDSSYGYTKENPLPMKKGNSIKSNNYTNQFLSGLRTEDNQSLKIFEVYTTSASYKAGQIILLSEFVLLTSTTNDTLRLFVDQAKKGKLKLPVGLRYN